MLNSRVGKQTLGYLYYVQILPLRREFIWWGKFDGGEKLDFRIFLQNKLILKICQTIRGKIRVKHVFLNSVNLMGRHKNRKNRATRFPRHFPPLSLSKIAENVLRNVIERYGHSPGKNGTQKQSRPSIFYKIPRGM